jgi:hypothetical protein
MLNAIAIEEGSDCCYILEDGTWFNNTCDFLADLRFKEECVDIRGLCFKDLVPEELEIMEIAMNHRQSEAMTQQEAFDLLWKNSRVRW